MTAHPIRRVVAVLATVSLTLTFAGSAFAAEVEPAAKKPAVKCDGKVATKVGTPGNDVIRGTAKRDIIAGLGGNDIILGGGGDDILCGGPGNDRITGNAGKDKLIGGGGRDRLFGGDGPDRLFGGPANDFLAGQAGPDVLGGGPNADRLDGGIGVDLCAQNTGSGPMVRCELPKSVFDTDGDGLLNSSDACPNQGGIVGANGCPLDSDGDGVVDNDDKCPNKGDQGYGLAPTGCPLAPGTLVIGGPASGQVGGTFYSSDNGSNWTVGSDACRTDYFASSRERMAMEFPLSGLPAGASVTKAMLGILHWSGTTLGHSLYGYGGNGTIEIADIKVGGTPVLFNPSAPISVTTVDVTNLVTPTVVASGWAGLAMRKDVDNINYDYWDCLASDSMPPTLTVDYLAP